MMNSNKLKYPKNQIIIPEEPCFDAIFSVKIFFIIVSFSTF